MRTASHDSSGIGSPAGAGRSGMLLGGLLRRDRSTRRPGGRWAPFGRPGGRDEGTAGGNAEGIAPDVLTSGATAPDPYVPGATVRDGGTPSQGKQRDGRDGDDGDRHDRVGGSRTDRPSSVAPAVPSVAPAVPSAARTPCLPTLGNTDLGHADLGRANLGRADLGWPRVDGPGRQSFALFAGEFLVLVAYLAVAAVISANPLAHALIEGARWSLQAWLVGLWLVTVTLFALGGAYRQRLNLSVWEELPGLSWRAALAVVGVVALADHVAGDTARDAVAILGVAGIGSHLVVRVGAFALLREARQFQRTVSRTLVVGGGVLSFKAVELLEVHREYGLLVLGYVDDVPAPLSEGPAGWAYLGQVEDLPGVVRRLRIQTVLVGFGSGSDALAAQTLRSLVGGRPGVQVFTVPRLFELGRRPLGQDHAGPIPLTRVRPASRRGPRWAFKRASDVVVAVVGLVLAAPLLGVLAAAVRRECGPGPVIVDHEHVGRGGAVVPLWRFRTARPGRGPGPVGRLLRTSWLGRLPMLWNLLVGDLALVGPRPVPPATSQRLQRMLPHYEHRLQVRGGLVGPGAAAPCAGEPPADEAVLYDTAYVENWGLWTDVTVLAHGLRRLVRSRLVRKGVAGVRSR